MINRPGSGRRLNCASQLSWSCNEEEVSDSAILSTASRKLGTEPVVMPLMRGRVTVGGAARAVNGRALPDAMRLRQLDILCCL